MDLHQRRQHCRRNRNQHPLENPLLKVEYRTEYVVNVFKDWAHSQKEPRHDLTGLNECELIRYQNTIKALWTYTNCAKNIRSNKGCIG